ncbi:MAG: MFS transporter, partial [Dehalococcoidia bacterium]|nr:MFS transporter [Dehalococcoidia bacterium]
LFKPAENGRTAKTGVFTSLQHPDYRRLWFANVSAGSAHWALIVARGWLVFELTDSSTLVGIVTFAAMIPTFLLSPFAGLLADRIDRRKLLGWTFGLNAAHNLLLAALSMAGIVEVWHLIVLSFINGSARAAQMPATGSLLPNLVPRHHLLNAIALSSASIHGTRLAGPLLIAPLLATVGTAGAFALCTVFYLLGLFQVSRIRTPSTGIVESEKGGMENLLAGLHYVYHHHLLLPLTLLAVAHCALTMSFESLLPVLAKEKLGVEGAGFSYMMMAVGAGALVGVIGLTKVQNDAVRGRLLLVTGIVSGVTPIALAVSPNLPIALFAAAGMGASQGGFMTLFTTIVQSIVPDAIRGRITSITNLHIGGFMAGFNLVNGHLADIVGAPAILAVTGVIFLMVVPLSFSSMHIRQLYSLNSQGV